MTKPPFTLSEMKPNELDPILKELAARPIPGAPGNLAASVLREVRLRRATNLPLVEMIANWLWRGQVALASVPAAVVMGVLIALTLPAQEARPAVSRALYLNVFSQDSPTLPSTYIALGH
ncbi:MAG: hypothetical protein ACR2HH_13810 [Chthoniobacterales bacterium]